MTIHTDKHTSMLAQVVRGVSKHESHLVTDEASSAEWDRVVASVADARTAHPDAVIDVPTDV